MCGFVGFIDKNNIETKKIALENMMNRIIHRGPDSAGTYVDEKAALGFRRLSIIDLEHGSQPIYNENKDLVIVFNGEIYNFQEIKEDLVSKGHTFLTHTDTEVIIHGFEEYGKDIVKKLRGMFAFVIWNTKTNVMFGARDMFGIKPFYYSNTEDAFLFGSEIKSFIEHPCFHKEMNKSALKPYLTFQYSALNETFFKGVYKLEPGHCFTYANGKMEIETYHSFQFHREEKSFSSYVEEIEKVMRDSVMYHKISDVKVGSFLSGGVDSSYITECLRPDQTFSVGFENKGFSEVGYAEELSEILGIKNVNKTIQPDEFFDEMENIQYYSDEPHANLSAVPLYFLSRLAKEHVTVVLSGEGADELFGGYDSYALSDMEKKYRKLPKGLRHVLGNFATHLPKFRGRDFMERNGLNVEDWYIGQAHIFDEKDAVKVLTPNYQKAPSLHEITKPYFDKVKDADELTKKQYLDLHLWQPNDILLKADKMTMAHSLELRVPFLDKKVMELASKIPSEYKLQNGLTKYVLRESAYKVLPEEWAKRPKKGFPVPFSKWILEEKYYKRVKDVFTMDFVSEFFDKERINKLLDDHYHQKTNNGRKVYTIYTFLLWYKVYFIDEK